MVAFSLASVWSSPVSGSWRGGNWGDSRGFDACQPHLASHQRPTSLLVVSRTAFQNSVVMALLMQCALACSFHR